MRKLKLSPTTVIALAALFVALGGVGVAATGDNLILGQSNAAGAKTSLTAGVSDRTLALTNMNTSSSATALGLNVAASRPPLIVNSSTKVTNLNADKLDGVNSAGFVRGRGTFLANRLVFTPPNGKPLLTIPGLGYLDATCNADAYVNWHNDTGGTVNFWRDLANSHFEAAVAPSGAGRTILDRFSGVPGGTLALGVGNDPGPRRIAVLHLFLYQSGDNAPCGFQVEGTLWTSQ